MRFADRVALVTGGGGGIGRSVVRLLASEGARVGVLDHDAAAAAAVARELGPDVAMPLAVDVRDTDAVRAAVDSLVDNFGRVDLLHNHAGVLPMDDASVLDVSIDVVRNALDVNVIGQLNVAQAVARHMAKNGSGVIVNTASDLSLIALPGIAAYVTSKTAILGLTRSMAVDLAPHNIRVNAVCPGFVSTGMTAAMESDDASMSEMRKSYLMPSLGKPDDIAEVVAFLLSDASRYMTGSSVVVDGGHVVT
jgi:NAD(P)-dependent dehydrogenase (short-subunit alcohol dehydrogenase family)